MRLELAWAGPGRDGRAERLLANLNAGFKGRVRAAAVIDVYLLDGVSGLDRPLLEEVFLDPIAQAMYLDRPAAPELLPDWNALIEITYKPGVTDPEALTAREALRLAGAGLPAGALVQSARQYVLAVEGGADFLARLAGGLYNRLIQTETIIDRPAWLSGRRFAAIYPHAVPASPASVEHIDLEGLDEAGLAELSRRRLLSLSAAEMKAIRAYYRRPDARARRAGLKLPPAAATDVELEMLAQTWSEHCKHKIFAARIEYEEDGRRETIDSLFSTFIKSTTEELKARRPDLRSVFHDNSGVVDFDGEDLVCIKVETHNSPSALDPYGGAITGIVGVNRDILGTGLGARPIFNTDVLCFGEPDMDEAELPAGLLHPREVLAGVHRGIVDGGNQSGIPTAAGAFLFDPSFAGKPLVFCGTAGIMPRLAAGRESWRKYHRPGDLAVVAGGRVGKDGIHGATFSSAALDEQSPTSAVQIGDPITQRRLTDFLLEARDRGLYSGITDNGAGGISSSLGEMASAAGGVRIKLDDCLVKYAGLAPWEILVSESQERMSFAVPPEKLEDFLGLAGRRGVEAAVVGEFTADGFVDVYYENECVASLPLDFLHDGLPRLELKARWIAPPARGRSAGALPGADHAGTLLRLLSDPSIASKETLVRQYDHEVQAGSVVKPFCGAEADGPTDGAVIRPKYGSRRGLTVTHGICPRLGDQDTYLMALAAVDEAYRSHIALGGHPDLAAALDNFCWPDPVRSAETPDGEYKLAQLVRACRGLKQACLAYNLPLVSGKDSMKNDARIGGRKLSVRPTLLVTVMGIIEDVGRAMTPDFKRAGRLVYLAGADQPGLGCSYFEKLAGRGLGPAPELDPAPARRLYLAMHAALAAGCCASVHDLSDGGLAVALAESALGGRLGVEADIEAGLESGLAHEALLFGEAPARFLVEVDEARCGDFERRLAGCPLRSIGRVTERPEFILRAGGQVLVSLGLDALEQAWKSLGRGGRK